MPIDPAPQAHFDAIVIGSGISGGWVAKELCERGLKTLLVERGRMVEHRKDYPTAMTPAWEFPHRGKIPPPVADTTPIVSHCYAFNEATQHFFVKDAEHPYIQEKPFSWIRGYQVGGKSLLWARQTQRWGPMDFEGPLRDGFAVDWPIRYPDLAPWYSHVESFAGISGNKDGLAELPDGDFLPPWEMNSAEKTMKARIEAAFPGRHVVQGRCAHLTEPREQHLALGRGKCQARNLCERGCPFGAYFSTNSATLPAAQKTGNLTLKTHAVVEKIIYDEAQEKATGIRVIDAQTHAVQVFSADLVFVNASTLNTNLLLLHSTSNRFPNGLGNDCGWLGKGLAFHNYRGTLTAVFPGEEDKYHFGRRPTQVMVPNFRNVHGQETDFKRGYMVHFNAHRKRGLPEQSLGAPLKQALSQAGPWVVYMMMQGETLPKESNRVYLHETERDAWGIPQLVVDIAYDGNDELLLKDFFAEGRKMLTAAGCTQIQDHDSGQAPGLDIHEMGGVRMGRNPKDSLLDAHNRLHACPNVFVTDGACMTSTGTQNPSLTYMALSARAAAFAAEKWKAEKGS